MSGYVLRRTALIIPTVFAASVLVFAVMRALPGDVALAILADTPHTVEIREALREQLGLNDPLATQYLRWMASMLSGGFGGASLETGQPIGGVLGQELGVTLLLALYAVTVSVAAAVPLSVAAALRRGRALDRAVEGFALGSLALPTVFASLLAVWLLLRIFRWSPPIIYSGPVEDIADHAAIMIWPTLLLAGTSFPYLLRVARARIIEVLASDYAESARARGLSDGAVIVRHALPNAMLALVTVVGLQFGALISGTLVVESVFGLPGLGRGIVHAALARDYPVVQSAATVLVALVLVMNMLVDLACARIDPRVRYDRRRV